jgi:hypothetical protein
MHKLFFFLHILAISDSDTDTRKHLKENENSVSHYEYKNLCSVHKLSFQCATLMNKHKENITFLSLSLFHSLTYSSISEKIQRITKTKKLRIK